MVLNEYPTTRGDFVSIGPGKLFQSDQNTFHRGLVCREGNKKGVHIIDHYGQAQLCLSMDYCKKVFFPNNVNFMDFINQFVENQNFEEVQKLCHGLLLTPLDNDRRILRFKKFVNLRNILDGALMLNADDEIFHLNQIVIKEDQKITIDFLNDRLKENVLKLNRFDAHQRRQFIIQQIHRFNLNNHITSAFGIATTQVMLRGKIEIFPPINTVGANNIQLAPLANGAFQLNPQNYYKRSNLNKVIVLSSRINFQKCLKPVTNIIQLATCKKGNDIEFKEFDLFSTNIDAWVNCAESIKSENIGKEILILAIDGPYDAHFFLKYSESQTGLQTQQIMTPTLINADFNTQRNICHKTNVKMGGLNIIVKFGNNVVPISPELQRNGRGTNLDINNNDILVIAIDVCHGSTTEPSTVGISANYLYSLEFQNFFFYGKTRTEVIEKDVLFPYIQKLLMEACKNRKIEKIVIIRDGIDEGRFSRVIGEEVAAIKSAAIQVGINAKFVVFVINKKTNTRHFTKENNRVVSLPPRSFINWGCRYKFVQFYCVPHKCVSGTAVSPLITIVLDEIGISKLESQEFILGLTYLHQIVNKPISIPSPVYQADEIAHRGQMLFRTLKKYKPEKIQYNENGEINFEALTEHLSFSKFSLPFTRYNA
uniref:Piwi domain-containing protein n=1 Tax=Panagrolaimus davidi TaxID=227884 RepID=A0A914P9B8_9BILA